MWKTKFLTQKPEKLFPKVKFEVRSHELLLVVENQTKILKEVL